MSQARAIAVQKKIRSYIWQEYIIDYVFALMAVCLDFYCKI